MEDILVFGLFALGLSTSVFLILSTISYYLLLRLKKK